MQNAGITALGLDWKYLAFDVHPDELRSAIEGAKAMRYIGLNLTVPHKLLAMEMVDDLDESAREWGAVNTIRFEGRSEGVDWQPLGGLAMSGAAQVRSRGFNTDAEALACALREELRCNLAGSTVLVLGAGGAGRVAALKMAAEHAKELILINRTTEKAIAIADEIKRRFPNTATRVGYPAGAVDLVINATSLGLRPNDSLPFEESRFSLKNARAVYDMIYRPSESRLLETAKAAGCRTANGLGMLLYQGAKALEIWTGKPAPVEVMKKALEENIYGSRKPQ